MRAGIRSIAALGLPAACIVAGILAWAFPVWPGDKELLSWIQAWQSPALTGVFRAVTHLGSYPVATALTVAAAGILLLRRLWAEGLLVVAAAASALLTLLFKALVGRPRPAFSMVDPSFVDPIPHTLSFPSGHAAFAMLLGGILIYLVWRYRESRWARWGISLALAVAILAVGVSRVYLGVHWPSDVLGGYLYGITALALLIPLKGWLVRRGERPSLG